MIVLHLLLCSVVILPSVPCSLSLNTTRNSLQFQTTHHKHLNVIKLQRCYNKCVKIFFSVIDAVIVYVTSALLDTGLPSLNTLYGTPNLVLIIEFHRVIM